METKILILLACILLLLEEVAQGKLRFLGSATLPENHDALLPDPMRKVLDTAPDKNMRELFKDLAVPCMTMASLLQSLTLLAYGDATVRELETRLGPFVEKTLPMIRRLGGVA